MNLTMMTLRPGSQHVRRLAVGVATAMAITVAGCASTDVAPAAGSADASVGAVPSPSADASSPDAGDLRASDPSASDTSAVNGAYPATVKTLYGDVTIHSAPQRVVALNVATADELISLGVEPLAVAVDPATVEASYPWMVDALGGRADATLSAPSGELSPEAIARLDPDLIVAQTWQIPDQATFDQLSDIAPTVTADSQALNVDWDERLLKTAEAVGRSAEAEQLITDIGAEFAEAGDPVPDVSSKTYQWVRVDPDGYGFGNGSVLELFGLQPADNQDNTQNGPALSKEMTAELDADVLGIWAPTEELRAALDSDPLFQALPSVQNKTVFFADLALANAANGPAPMALRWLKDKLAPTVLALG